MDTPTPEEQVGELSDEELVREVTGGGASIHGRPGLHGRPDLIDFLPGYQYLHNETGEVVRYVGVALAALGDGEDVGVFEIVPQGGCLLVTQPGYSRGERFTPVEEEPGATSGPASSPT